MLAKKERKEGRTVGFTRSAVDEIDWLQDESNPNRKFVSFTDGVNKLVAMGLLIMKQKGDLGSAEMIKKMNGIIDDENTMDWLQNLSPTQRMGLGEMLKMIKEQEQKKLI